MRKLILAVTTTIAVLAPALMLAAGASATTGSESFSFIDTSTADTPLFSVIATGAFVAGGTATRPSTGVLKLSFPNGTITLNTGKKPKVTTVHQTATVCIETQSNTGGHFTITGGTGAYKGITGSGRVTAHSTFIEQVVNGQCASAYTAVQAIATASGPISLP
ncbi:MAG: hypothetical protein ABSH51_21605 [Solirubrobacteraceae bacterium]|jgi:hypothetical protein